MTRRVTRRVLLQTIPTTLVSALLLACQQQQSPTPTTTVPSVPGLATATPEATQHPPIATPTESPRAGGILQMHFEADPSTFDAHATSSDPYWVIPCFSSLLRFDFYDDTKIVPDLAERWEVSTDRRVYTFHLRRNALFHDGSPVTSRDVQVSLERIINPPSGVRSLRRHLFDTLDHIEAPDDHTVRIVLKEPDESLLATVAQDWIAIYPAKLIESGADLSQPENMIGSGPFKFKRYTRGVSVELERNPNFYIPNRPYLDGLIWYIMPDPNSVINAFISGQLHIYRPLSLPPLDYLQSQLGDDLVVSAFPHNVTYGVALNSNFPPFRDQRVREALNIAIDRNAALSVILKGYGKLSGYMHPDGAWALPEDRLRQIPGFGGSMDEHIQRARQLLADAGYPDGFEVRLLTARGERSETPMSFVRDQWAKIGVRATLDTADLPVFVQRYNVDRDWDAAQSVLASAVDDPKAVFGSFLDCNAPGNVTGICEDELLDLYNRQAQEPDPNQRKELVQELDYQCLTQAGSGRILLYRSVAWWLYKRSIVGGWWNNDHPYRPFYGPKYDTVWLKKS